MATFKVIAGDFGEGKQGRVLIGSLYKKSSQGFYMPLTGHIGTGQIETIEIATEENLKKMGGSIGWGLIGGLTLGPVGALAGVLAGGNKTTVTFVCKFKDGRKFLGSCAPKTFTLIQAASFESHMQPLQSSFQSQATSGKSRRVVLAVVTFLIGLTLFASLLSIASRKTETSPAVALNQSAVSLVSYLLLDDIEAGLKGQDSATWRMQDLLALFRIDRRAGAKEYDAAYEANEIAADNDFKGKRILLSGTIISIDKDFTDEGFITLRGSRLRDIHAQLSATGMSGAASLSRGQQVNLVCDGTGRVLSVATLNNCDLFEHYLNRLSPSIESNVAAFLRGQMALRKDAAAMVATMYAAGLSMPADSPCMNGTRESCEDEMMAIFKDKAKVQAIQNQLNKMMNSLKMT
jgi:tRNA_anti-like